MDRSKTSPVDCTSSANHQIAATVDIYKIVPETPAPTPAPPPPTPAPPLPPEISNFGFETGSTTNGFEYVSTLPSWTISGATPVLIRSGNVDWGGTTTADGSYFLGLQGSSTGAAVSQVVPNHLPGRAYELHFDVAMRANYDQPTIQVWIGGQKVHEMSPGSSSFTTITVPYVATASNMEIELKNGGTESDRTVFIDAISIQEAPTPAPTPLPPTFAPTPGPAPTPALTTGRGFWGSGAGGGDGNRFIKH